jgi:hypothetical protein
MSLVLQSSGGGSVTLEEAVTASNLTITVPAVTGTMLTTASTGTVLQVVQGTYSTQVSTTSNSYSDTGLTATITPTSATSKILVIVSQNGCKNGNSIYAALNLVLLRNASVVNETVSIGYSGNTLNTFRVPFVSFSVLDAPATTSAITYKTQLAMQSGGAGTVYAQDGSSTSYIQLLEIAG